MHRYTPTGRVARIEETMAAREALDEPRARVRHSDTTPHWLGRSLLTAAIVAGFPAPLLVFAR